MAIKNVQCMPCKHKQDHDRCAKTIICNWCLASPAAGYGFIDKLRFCFTDGVSDCIAQAQEQKDKGEQQQDQKDGQDQKDQQQTCQHCEKPIAWDEGHVPRPIGESGAWVTSDRQDYCSGAPSQGDGWWHSPAGQDQKDSQDGGESEDESEGESDQDSDQDGQQDGQDSEDSDSDESGEGSEQDGDSGEGQDSEGDEKDQQQEPGKDDSKGGARRPDVKHQHFEYDRLRELLLEDQGRDTLPF